MLYNTILGHIRALEAHHWQVSNLYILPTMHLYFSCLCFAARNHGSKAKKVSSVALWWCQNVNFISQACITRTNHRQHIYSPFCNCLLAAVVSYQRYWWSTVGLWSMDPFLFLFSATDVFLLTFCLGHKADSVCWSESSSIFSSLFPQA